MRQGFRDFINRVLADTSRQLQLCCSRQVGNIPADAFAKGQIRPGRCC
jgi:hypothetical protein